MARLVIRGLRKTFEGSEVVRGVEMDVPQGEFVSILGPSGCGKTTTLRCVAGLETPSAGRILFGDSDVTKLAPERRMIGMVFQNYALFPHLTVRENVAFGLEMRGVRGPAAAERVSRIMDMVQLPDLGDRYPSQLSGGQQQRVALARALVVEPTILLLDEPLANLDAKLRDEMRGFIRALQRRVGITTLYVTHDQAESMSMSDRIAIMFSGRIHQFASAEEVYQRPADRKVAEFIGASNFFAGKARKSGEGFAEIHTAVGPVFARAETIIADGADAVAMIRPEAVEIVSPAAGGFAGVVAARQFLGNVNDYDIRLADGQIVRVQTNGAVNLNVGDATGIRIPPDKAWLLNG